MNICMITHKSQSASVPRAYAMAKQMISRGHHVTLLLISKTKQFGTVEYDWNGIRAVESPDLLWGRLRTGWDIWNTLNRIHFLSKETMQYDLIHCFETRPVTIYPALYLKRKRKIPLITDWNDWWGRHGLIDVNRPFLYRYYAGWFETYFEEAFRVDADGLTVIAKGLEERAIKLGVIPDHICHIPGGAMIEFFPDVPTDECRKHSNLPLTDPILGFCSADSHLDMDIVMSAMTHVLERFPTAKLLITGKVKREVQQMVQKYQLTDQIIFSGFLSVTDYPLFLGSSDVFLLPMDDRPYNYGRWPNKMGDYLSLGKPTVSNAVGDIKTLFDAHEVGLLAEWDPKDFADKIIFLLEHPETSEKMGQKARWVAENVLSWTGHGERLEKFYNKILNDYFNATGQTPA